MLSKQEVEAYIEFITTELDALAASGDPADNHGHGSGPAPAGANSLAETEKRFRSLGDQYRCEPETLAGLVDRLSELRRRFNDLLAERLALVVDRYHEVNEELRLREEEKKLWRDLLIRHSTRAREEHLTGLTATIRVRSVQSRALPPVGNEDRRQLEELIRAGGCWEKVSQLSRAKLQRALADSELPQAQTEAIERLCPAVTMHQVSCRPLGQSGGIQNVD